MSLKEHKWEIVEVLLSFYRGDSSRSESIERIDAICERALAILTIDERRELAEVVLGAVQTVLSAQD